MLRYPLRRSVFPLANSAELIERRDAARFTLEASDPEGVIAIYFKDVNVPPNASINQQKTKTTIMRAQTVVTKKKRASRTPSRKSGIERYSRIIEAAESLICEAGSLDGLTLDLIAKRAEVPRVSLYYFFDSIEPLVDALYQKGSDEMLAEFPDPPQSLAGESCCSSTRTVRGSFTSKIPLQ